MDVSIYYTFVDTYRQEFGVLESRVTLRNTDWSEVFERVCELESSGNKVEQVQREAKT